MSSVVENLEVNKKKSRTYKKPDFRVAVRKTGEFKSPGSEFSDTIDWLKDIHTCDSQEDAKKWLKVNAEEGQTYVIYRFYSEHKAVVETKVTLA